MSTATGTTSTITTQDYLQVLANYDLHHSGDLVEPTVPLPSNLSLPESQRGRNAQGWPEDHQRIPIYRPIDRNLSFEDRPRGRNLSENIFITVMLNGCGINAVRQRYKDMHDLFAAQMMVN